MQGVGAGCLGTACWHQQRFAWRWEACTGLSLLTVGSDLLKRHIYKVAQTLKELQLLQLALDSDALNGLKIYSGLLTVDNIVYARDWIKVVFVATAK